MDKRFVLFVSFVLLLGTLSASMATGNEDSLSKKRSASVTPRYIDELDQSQSVAVQDQFIPVGRVTIAELVFFVQVAQSFIPTKEVLTRVELLIGKNTTTTYPFVVGIKDNLTHENLREITVPASDVITDNYSWVEFDFEDLWVTPGQTYYIVSTTMNVSDNWFVWAANNQSEAYLNGCAWVSLDNGSTWNQSASLGAQQQNNNECINNLMPLFAENDTGDMCFRTFGLQETTLSVIPMGGLFPHFVIRNTGNVTAWDINITYGIQGGFIFFGNRTISIFIPELEPGNETAVTLGLYPLLGFGHIEITLTIKAANVRECSTTMQGFLLLFFIVGLH